MKLLHYICFERYLMACLGGEDNTIKFMESKSLISSSIPLIEESYTYGIVEHHFPLNYMMREWYLGPDFYQAVKIGIVQYMILKLICAFLAIFFQFLGVYGKGKFEWGYTDGTTPCLNLILGGNLTQGIRKASVGLTIIITVMMVRYLILPVIGIGVIEMAANL